MPLPVGQVQAVLECYNRQLRAAKTGDNSKPLLKDDIVNISSEGKRRELLDKIGNDAVRAYKKNVVNQISEEARKA